MSTVIKVGDKVRFTNKKKHDTNPEYYPGPGRTGVVLAVDQHTAMIQWPAGTTSGDGIWRADFADLVKLEEAMIQ